MLTSTRTFALLILLTAARLLADGPASSRPAAGGRAAVGPVNAIYSSDLFHPHDDPDDHFDLATLFSLENVRIRAVVLDLGERQKDRPGRIPLTQMMALTGKKVPYATGLSTKLESLTDTGTDQPKSNQGGVELILKTLRDSKQPVTIITTGSLRDVCAAFNRDPDLLRRRVARLYINIGNADGANEWNGGLDPQAYIAIMRSGLPIYWCPCLPPRDPRSTFWEFTHADVLQAAPTRVQNFFIYALQAVPPDLIDPVAALEMDLRPWKHLVWAMRRPMWCTAAFLHAGGYEVIRTAEGHYQPQITSPGASNDAAVFGFVPARVEIDGSAKTRIVPDGTPNMHVFRTPDPKTYDQAMTDCLRYLLAGLRSGAKPQRY